MTSKIVLRSVKSDQHTKRWISALSDLHDNQPQYCDVDVQVGTAVFKCHKLILALKSTYFQQCLFPAAQATAVHQIKLDGITPEEFKNVMRFTYKGVVEMDGDTVVRVLEVAELLNLTDLQRLCLQFMGETVYAELFFQFLSLANEMNDSNLRRRCLNYSRRNSYLSFEVVVCMTFHQK